MFSCCLDEPSLKVSGLKVSLWSRLQFFLISFIVLHFNSWLLKKNKKKTRLIVIDFCGHIIGMFFYGTRYQQNHSFTFSCFELALVCKTDLSLFNQKQRLKKVLKSYAGHGSCWAGEKFSFSHKYRLRLKENETSSSFQWLTLYQPQSTAWRWLKSLPALG